MPFLYLLVAGQSLLALLAGSLLGADTPPPERELHTADAVPVHYYLSLPADWNPATSWPLLVSIDGSGHNFAGNFHGFVGARGKLPFIIVTPCVSSNGNDPADLQAVLAIAAEVERNFHGQPKLFLTGFSAGGHLTWQMIFQHPDKLAGAFLSAANFRFRGVDQIPESPAAAALPIHGAQGDKDGHFAALEEQWNDAVALALQHGYAKPNRDLIPGGQHQAFQREAMAWFASLLAK